MTEFYIRSLLIVAMLVVAQHAIASRFGNVAAISAIVGGAAVLILAHVVWDVRSPHLHAGQSYDTLIEFRAHLVWWCTNWALPILSIVVLGLIARSKSHGVVIGSAFIARAVSFMIAVRVLPLLFPRT
jgi:hypothetical protein